MAVEFFRTFSDYDRQAAEARRRRAMADLLAQQVAEPTQYGPGPTPAAAPLVRGLQAFLAARAAKKAGEAEEGVKATEARTGEQIAGRLTGGAPVRDIAPPDASGLDEVAVTSQYKASPEDAFRLALSPAGAAATRGKPMLAAMLARSMEKPKQLEVGAIDPSKFTPQSLAAAMQSGDVSKLEPRDEGKAPTVAGGMMWSAEQNKFVPIEGYAEQQERIARAKRPDVVVAGSGKTQLSVSPTETGQFLTDEEAVKAGFAPGTVVRRRDGVVLQAPPQAQRVSQANKAAAVNRVDQVASRLMRQMDNIKTGGVLGVTGALSKVFDSQDAKLFESYRQQLSAALRSALRIPGEGALSDYEQQLYGLQLPELGQSKENNIAIMQSLKEQVRLAAGQEADLEEGVVDLPPRR